MEGCEKIYSDLEFDADNYRRVGEMEWTPLPISEAEYQLAVEAIQRRARQIAGVEWHTIGDVPRNGGFFSAGMTINGVPYSSVKELDKFIGHEVSFYTFLTAAQNSRSVLYTENVALSPYHGMNCASYYGTVCSMAVNYALGFNVPYESSMYANLPFIQKVEKQNPSSVKVGDILWRKGHVVMVEDVVRDKDGSISRVDILESAGSYTKIRTYTLSSFTQRWKESSWVLYRYLDFKRILEQDEIPFLSSFRSDNYSVNYTSAICPNRGDRACYREGEDVVLNVLQFYNGVVIVQKDGCEFKRMRCSGKEDIVLSGLTAGKYVVILSEGQINCSFEVLQTTVLAKKVSSGILVSFESVNGLPESLTLCSSIGARKFIHEFTETERIDGGVIIPGDFYNIYVKVKFRGEFGRVSNEAIHIL